MATLVIILLLRIIVNIEVRESEKFFADFFYKKLMKSYWSFGVVGALR